MVYKHIYFVSKKALGIVLIAAGVISLFLPVIPGVLLLLAGLLLWGFTKKDMHGFYIKVKKKLNGK